jgi:hypothetical protein
MLRYRPLSSAGAPPPRRNDTALQPFSASPTPECLDEPPLPYPCPTGSRDLTSACPDDLAPQELPPHPHRPCRRVSIARGDQVRAYACRATGVGPTELFLNVVWATSARPRAGFGPSTVIGLSTSQIRFPFKIFRKFV